MLAVLSALAYSAVAVVRYCRFEFTSFDLSIFTQAVDSWAHGHLPVSTVRGGPGFAVLGDHFSPALAVLVPAYLIAPSPVTLLVAQAVLFGVSAVPIARLAERRLGRSAAALIAPAYVLSWGLQYAVVVDFHEIALAVPLLAAGVSALVDRRWRAAAYWLLPLLLVKEDLGATVSVAGACMLWRGGKREGIALILAGALGSAIEIVVLIPWARASGSYAYTSSLAGKSFSQLLSSLFLPIEKLQTVILLLGVVAFVCVRSCVTWLIVPTLLWRFASSTTSYWGHEWHYSAVLMPIVFIGAIEALSILHTGRRAGFASHLPSVIATIAVLCTHVTPLGAFLNTNAWASTTRVRAAEVAVAMVPLGSTVETDIGLMSHLTSRRITYFCGNHTSTIHPGWFVTDQSAWGQPMTGEETLAYAHQLHPRQSFQVVYEQAGITVLRNTARPLE